MVTRRKQRPLSREELRDKLILQSASRWLHSDPLCALLPLGANGPEFLALHPSTEKDILVICLLDPGNYLSDRMVEIMTEWKNRYRNLPWRPVLVFPEKYLFLKNQKFFDHFKQIAAFNVTALYLDPNSDWFSQFDAISEPKVIFLDRGKIIFESRLKSNFSETVRAIELKLQESFRTDEPGLPLPEVGPAKAYSPLDDQNWLSEQLTLSGVWMPSPGCIATDDSQGSFSFPFEGNRVRLIATTHPKARENAKVQIMFNDRPLPASAFGDQVHANDKGQVVFEINRNTGIYELVESVILLKGTLKISFLNATENPVIVYELRTSRVS